MARKNNPKKSFGSRGIYYLALELHVIALRYQLKGTNMLDQVLFSKTNLAVMNKTLDASMLRARVIANNIANVNTPGYQRVDVKFEKYLADALDRSKLKGATTNERHMGLGKPRIGEINATAYRPIDPTLPSGVNNVDIDEEMAKLAENQIIFNYAVKFEKGVFNKINAAIQAKSLPQQ